MITRTVVFQLFAVYYVSRVSDEKDARGYLQALASKMTEELENLKVMGVSGEDSGRQRWRNRRSQRLDKMELLNLQSSLNSEIQAKSQISEELSKMKTQYSLMETYVYVWVFSLTVFKFKRMSYDKLCALL